MSSLSKLPSAINRLLDSLAGRLSPRSIERWAVPAFMVVFLIAAAARALAAPYSATQDMAQFWSFAQLFKEHGLDFYAHYSGTEPINPFYAWGYFYPPIWLLLLGLALAAVPTAMAGEAFTDIAWRIAMKAPIITADLVIGILLFVAIPGSKWRKTFFAALWLLNPAAWYQSAIFGQFDAIAAAFLLGSVVLLERGHDRWVFAVAALAVMTKQHTLFPVVFMMAVTLRSLPWRRSAVNLAVFAGVAAAVSLPFLVTGNVEEYLRAVLLPGQPVAYQQPMVYAFSGSGALFTYFHDAYGWETVGWLRYNAPILVVAVIGGLALSYVKRVAPLRAALIGILLFIAIYHRINYQYLIIFMPLAVLAAARTTYLSERIVSLGLAVFPAVWMWYFNVSFWFNYATPVFPVASEVLSNFGWTHDTAADIVYVRIALAVMALAVAYIVLAFTRWRKPLKPIFAGPPRQNLTTRSLESPP